MNFIAFHTEIQENVKVNFRGLGLLSTKVFLMKDQKGVWFNLPLWSHDRRLVIA